MTGVSKIILVMKPSRASLPFLAALSVVGFDIRYMFYPDYLKKKEISADDAASRMLRLGLKKVVFSDVPELDQYGFLRHSPEYGHELMEKLFGHVSLEPLSAYFFGITSPNEKLRVLLFDAIIHSIIEIGDMIAVAKAYRDMGHSVHVFHSADIVQGYVLTKKVSGFRNLVPTWLSAPLRIVSTFTTKLRGFIVRRLSKRNSGQASSPFPARDSETPTERKDVKQQVAYFPHMGVAYGSLFLKDHYYDEAEDSPLHPSRILHIELHQEPSEQSVKYYDENDISYSVMPLSLGFDAKLFSQIRRVTGPFWKIVRKQKRLVDAVFAFLIFMKGYLLFYRGYRNTENLHGVQLALIGYDYLFPTGLALALQARGIHTAAVQERFIHVFDHYFHPVFDTYFVSGKGVRDRLKDNPYHFIGEAPIVGFVRSDILKNYQKQLKKSATPTVLVLDYHTNTDLFSDTFDPMFCWKSNRDFYRDILRLAEDHKDVQFIIRGKYDAWCSLPYFREIMDKIEASPNVEVNRQYDQMNVSYRLAAQSDFIIARQTSLGDEAMAAGVPVLFHDWREGKKYNNSVICDYYGYDVYVHSFEALSERLNAFLRNGTYMPSGEFDEMRAELFGEPAENTKRKIQEYLYKVLNNRTYLND